MRSHFRWSLALAGCGFALALFPAAARAGSIALANPDPQGTKSFWTAERLREARPLVVSVTPGAAEEEAAAEAAVGAAGIGGIGASAAGQGPVAGVRPDMKNRLFPDAAEASLPLADLEEPAALTGKAAGSAAGYFTSQRLVPLSADHTYPYTTVGLLFFTIPGQSGTFYCSASVIRLRIVATAAACVHSGTASPGFYQNFQFVPAYRDGVAPYGTWTYNYVVISSNWTTTHGVLPNATDYAVLEMDDLVVNGVTSRIGNVVGYLGYQISHLKPNHAHLLGYTSVFDGAAKMHQVTAANVRTAANANVEFGSDMRGGANGGPLIQDFGDNAATVKWIGAISYYYTSTALKVEGASTPDSRFASILSTVCAHSAGNC